MWYVYIIECEDGSLYTGITNNLSNRFRDHKSGRGGHYTKSHKPIKFLYKEEYLTKHDSLLRESEIKGWRRKKKLSLIKYGKPLQRSD